MSVIMTKELIYEHTFGVATNAINSSQCIILGFKFKDLKKGWINRVENKVISNSSFELFKLLQGVTGRSNQLTVINNFKLREKGIK